MRDLTEDVLDEVSLRLFSGLAAPTDPIGASTLIPFAEWGWLRASGHNLPELRPTGHLTKLASASLEKPAVWWDSSNPRAGFIKVRRAQTDTEQAAWLQFLNRFIRAARNSGVSQKTAVEFAGVMKEMEENIHVHSQKVRSGRVAFLASDGVFEFVVLDGGIGVLASLRQAEEFSHLRDHGVALQAATTTGVTRFGTGSGRGWGFSDLLVGMANANAHVRFRSGDHLLRVDGTGATTPTSMVSQRALATGFLIGIRIHA